MPLKKLFCLFLATASFDCLAVDAGSTPAQAPATQKPLKISFFTFNVFVEQPEDELIVQPDLRCEVLTIQNHGNWVLDTKGKGHWNGNQFICSGTDITDFARTISIRFPGVAAGEFPKAGSKSTFRLDQHFCGPLEGGSDICPSSDLQSINTEESH